MRKVSRIHIVFTGGWAVMTNYEDCVERGGERNEVQREREREMRCREKKGKIRIEKEKGNSGEK